MIEQYRQKERSRSRLKKAHRNQARARVSLVTGDRGFPFLGNLSLRPPEGQLLFGWRASHILEAPPSRAEANKQAFGDVMLTVPEFLDSVNHALTQKRTNNTCPVDTNFTDRIGKIQEE
jgi:hypothetical protein